jgi:dienelactone hydrolase
MTTIDLSTSAVEGTSPGLSAYVARPPGSGPWPGVVVVHEGSRWTT